MGLQRIRHNWATSLSFFPWSQHLEKGLTGQEYSAFVKWMNRGFQTAYRMAACTSVETVRSPEQHIYYRNCWLYQHLIRKVGAQAKGRCSLLLPLSSLSPKNSRQLPPDFWWLGHCVLFDNVYHSANMNLQDGKNTTPRKDYMIGKKIIRQLRMAIIHPYLCFGKKYCPRELALLITLSSVWGVSERRFRARCWWFPAVFLSMIKTNARLWIEPSLSGGSRNLYTGS